MEGPVGAEVVPGRDHGHDLPLIADSKHSSAVHKRCCACPAVIVFAISEKYNCVFFVLSVTTTGAVAQGRTALGHARALTVAARCPIGTHPHPFSLISSPSPVTMATATPSSAGATATAEGAVLVTRGSALAHDPALLSNWTGTERGRGTERETAPLISLRRNTNMSGGADIATGGRGLAPTNGKGSVATRANTIAAVDTQDTAATGAETHTHTHR